MKATEVTAGLAESNGSLLPDLWRDSLHVTCKLTACTPGSAPGPTLGNEYGKNLPFYLTSHYHAAWPQHLCSYDHMVIRPYGAIQIYLLLLFLLRSNELFSSLLRTSSLTITTRRTVQLTRQ